MGLFKRSTVDFGHAASGDRLPTLPERPAVSEPVEEEDSDEAALPDEDSDEARVLWGEHCFAEYRPDNDVQPWTVQKYDSDWSFGLDKQADVVELMRRLDLRGGQKN